MIDLLKSYWSKDYLTDQHLAGFDNYKVSCHSRLTKCDM